MSSYEQQEQVEVVTSGRRCGRQELFSIYMLGVYPPHQYAARSLIHHQNAGLMIYILSDLQGEATTS